jgi:oligopeptidase B
MDRLPSEPFRAPPLAPVRPREFELHGVRLRDDYAWLKAENWMAVLKDPSVLPQDIRAYLEAENAYAEAVLRGTKPLREALVTEMRARIKEDDSTVPEPDGPFAYFTRYREGGQHPLICREPRGGGKTEVLLDGDAEGAGVPFFDLHDADHSPDHWVLFRAKEL